MKNIQEYIELIKAEKAKAEQSAQLFINCGDNDYTDYHRGLVEAFALSIAKAELLLDINTNNDVPPQLNKRDVIRWQDFKEQKPIDGQNVAIVNFRTGQAIVCEWQTKYELLMKEDDKWIPSPAFV